MRRLTALFVSMVCFCTLLFAQNDRIKLPDFAYPQDVVKTAEELIKSSAGGERVLGALELNTAKLLIDYSSSPESAKYIQTLADNDKNPAVKALLKLLSAQLCKDFRYNSSMVNRYMDNDGTFQEQRTRLDSVITSLLKEALAIAPPTPLTEFRNAMDWNDLGLSIMPTVRDFVAWQAVKTDKSLLDKGLETAGVDSPIYYALQTDYKLPNTGKEEFMLGMLDKRAADYALYLYIDKLPGRSNLTDKQIESELDFFNKAKKKVEGSWVEKTIDGRVKLLTGPYFEVNFNESAIASSAMPVKIKGYNLDTLPVSVYSFESMDKAREAENKHDMLTDSRKVYSNTVRFNNSPVGQTVTDSITLPAGYYVLTVGEGDISCSNTFRVCPWLFVTLQNREKRWLQILDIHTGAPIKGAQAFLLQDNKTSSAGLKTDSKGCIELPTQKSVYQIGFRDEVSGKIIYYPQSIFPDNSVAREDAPTDATHYNITTDRPIYRPGEKVRMVLTAYDNDCTLKIPEKVVYVHLPSRKSNAKDNAQSKPLEVAFSSTDSYGRSTAEVTLPDDCELGDATFSLSRRDRYNSIGRIQVTDFKLNDLKITEVTSELTADSIIVRGMTANEAGVGIGNVTVNVNVDYNIYPRPAKDLAFEISTTSDTNGRFCFSVPRYYFGNLKSWVSEKDDVAKFDDSKHHTSFTAYISMNAMSPNGRAASAGESVNMAYPNALRINLDKTLNNRADGITFGVAIEGYNPPGDFTWSIIKYDDIEEKALLSGVAKVGQVALTPGMLKDVPVGEYIFRAGLSDGTAEDSEVSFTLYDLKEKYVPTDNPFLIIEPNLTGDKTAIKIGVKENNTNIWVNYIKSGNEKTADLDDLKLHKLNRGWHEIPVVLSHYDKKTTARVGIYAANEDGRIYQEKVNVEINPNDKFTLSCESFRDNLIPGTQETWQFVASRNNRPTEAAVFANLMNSKLSPFIYYGPLYPHFYSYSNRRIGFRIDTYQYAYFSSNRTRKIWDFRLNALVPDIKLPTWRNLFRSTNDSGEYAEEAEEVEVDGEVLYEVPVRAYGAVRKSAMTANAAVPNDAAIPESKAESIKIRGTGKLSNPLSSVELREPKVYTALWEPMLTTGEDGRVDVSFTVPGETTGWMLYAEAWTTDLLSARLTHSFTATKPVVVAPNPPRFVRVGDLVNLVSAVTNTTDSVMNVSIQIVVEADSVSLADALTDMTLAAGETRFVNTPVRVDATGGQLVYTVRASNGVTGDGERNAIPVLSSSALVTESRNFYLNPDQADFSVALPSPKGTDFSSELHFTTNPMWSVVEALPSAIEPWCKAATALAMSVYTSRTALDLDSRFPAAKDFIDIANARKIAEQSLNSLKELQTPDGGFKWGEWADGADRYSTLAVLDWLASEKDRAEVAALIKPALDYVDKTSVGKDGKVRPDFNYTVIRSFYGTPEDQNGSRVVNATVKDILSNWKKFSIDHKALAVIALKNLGYDKVAKTILGSLSQFGRLTDDRGFEFPNMPNILAYTHTLEAFATADPTSDIAQRIVQHLLYIRQGMNWGSSAFTSYAVRSIMTAAPAWVSKPSPVTVKIDGIPVDSKATGMAGVVNATVKGRELTICRAEPVTPAYGAVVSRFVAPLTDITPFSDGEVSISKTIVRTKADGSQEILGQNALVTPGERLTVILKVTANRPLSNLVVTDNRPAAFEPVVQVPQMIWSRSGSPFYLENRDAVTNIYIGYMPKGSAEYTYQVTVNNTGQFTTGLANVSSAIAPEITAHSGSTPFSLKNK